MPGKFIIPEHTMKDLREWKGLSATDTSKDSEIRSTSQMENLRNLCGWEIGDPSWADTFIRWAEELGMTVIHDERKL